MSDPTRRPDVTGRVRDWWDADAATYDDSSDHGWAAASPALRAAWNATLHRLLPGQGCRVLDVGAGTGFLSLAAARLGHRVTAVDLSGGCWRACRGTPPATAWRSRRSRGPPRRRRPGPSTPWSSGTCCGRCPTRGPPWPPGGAWRPTGGWCCSRGCGAGPTRSSSCAERAREGLGKLRGRPDHHHDRYDPSVLEELPLAGGTHPDRVVELVEAAGWGPAGWSGCATSSGPSSDAPRASACSGPPRFAVVAGST